MAKKCCDNTLLVIFLGEEKMKIRRMVKLDFFS